MPALEERLRSGMDSVLVDGSTQDRIIGILKMHGVVDSPHLNLPPGPVCAQPADEVSTTLDERRKTHGRFVDHARCTQRLKEVVNIEADLRLDRGQEPLTLMQREALSMILHKIGRIIAGDASCRDHWVDIAGYAMLAAGQQPTTPIQVAWGEPQSGEP